MATKRIAALVLLVCAVTGRTVAAQSMAEFAVPLPLFILADGTSGEHGRLVLVLVSDNRFEVSSAEDPCQLVSATVRVEDPKGLAAPVESVVQLIPDVQPFANVPVDMHGAPNSVRLVSVLDVQKQGACTVRVTGNLADAADASIGPIAGDRVLFAKYSGQVTTPPEGRQAEQGTILGSAIQGEKQVFNLLLIDRVDASTLELVSDGSVQGRCQSSSVQLTFSEPTKTVAPMVFDLELDVQEPFAEVEVPFSYFGDVVQYRMVFPERGTQGTCGVLFGGRLVALGGRTTWIMGTSMASPHAVSVFP